MPFDTPLTYYSLLGALTKHQGKENGISISALVYEITGEMSTPAVERDVRRLVKQLRMEGQHICAHPSAGYYIAVDADELNETCKFLVDRAMTSLQQVAQMKKVSVPDLYGQMNLLAEGEKNAS